MKAGDAMAVWMHDPCPSNSWKVTQCLRPPTVSCPLHLLGWVSQSTSSLLYMPTLWLLPTFPLFRLCPEAVIRLDSCTWSYGLAVIRTWFWILAPSPWSWSNFLTFLHLSYLIYYSKCNVSHFKVFAKYEKILWENTWLKSWLLFSTVSCSSLLQSIWAQHSFLQDLLWVGNHPSDISNLWSHLFLRTTYETDFLSFFSFFLGTVRCRTLR